MQAYIINPEETISEGENYISLSTSLSLSAASPVSTRLTINPFNFYLREVRVFSRGMPIATAIRYLR